MKNGNLFKIKLVIDNKIKLFHKLLYVWPMLFIEKIRKGMYSATHLFSDKNLKNLKILMNLKLKKNKYRLGIGRTLLY